MPAVVKYEITAICNWSLWLYLGWAGPLKRGRNSADDLFLLLCASLSESVKTLLVTFFRRDI